MQTLSIPNKIIQLCLFEGGAIKKSDFPELDVAMISEIKSLLAPLNLHLVENKNSIEICLSQEISEIINKQKIADLKTDLSESALQTLSVILYKPGTTKAEINFIRGVDSSRSIKSLHARGLIEKSEESKNKNIYYPTIETLKFMGLESVENLPEQNEINAKLELLLKGE